MYQINIIHKKNNHERKYKMKICVNEMLYAISYALDCVEREVLGSATINHSKRVACISTFIGRKIGLNKFEVLDLTTCALLHDNALTEYLNDEQQKSGNNLEPIESNLFRSHCLMGEENMKNVPTYGTIKNVVKYHHEHIDGTGAFGMTEDETPLYSKIIHMADQIDVMFDFSSVDEEKLKSVHSYLEGNKGTIYHTGIVDIFVENADISMMNNLTDDKLDNYLQLIMPSYSKEYDMKTIMNFIDIFAKIIDYKSEFTQKHTTELTRKAYFMSNYYGFDENTKVKFYMAAGLHDIGKMAIDAKILEKPDKLTNEEFELIKSHAYYTYKILSKIKNIDDVIEWASFHHEKLNGKGYPFGKTAEQLDHKCRLMACLDIYQALREERPYKSGFSHYKAMKILREMVKNGFIDRTIVCDLDIAFGNL